MKKINYKLQITNYKLILLLSIITFFFFTSIDLPVTASDKWGGVDESVVEKYAEEHGRAPLDPLINTDQGDLLLFMFLIGGIIAGFAAGYYWRTLTESGSKISECCTAKEKTDGFS